MRQEFEMAQEEMDDIIQINKDIGPVMQIGSVTTGMDRQENVNAYWDTLGNKYGFKPDTVEESSKGRLFFLAEPKPIVKLKTQTEIEMDKFDTLDKIVKHLESCGYTYAGGDLKTNIAFMKLKSMSKGDLK